MHKIKIYDSIFTHVRAMSNGDNIGPAPSFFEWYRGPDDTATCVFTDFNLADVDKCHAKVKIAMLMESPEIFPLAYDQILHIKDTFDFILTFDQETYNSLRLSGYKTAFTYPLGGCWIDKPAIYPKTKKVSMILSEKTGATGHKLRHEIMKKFPNDIDFYGKGIKPIENKLEALQDYQFSIVVENCQRDAYFTEKIIDCFMTGTIPIYWGCPSIDRFFENEPVTLPFCDLAILEMILAHIVRYDPIKDKAQCEQKIIQNCKMAQQYTITEDWLWTNVFSHIIQE